MPKIHINSLIAIANAGAGMRVSAADYSVEDLVSLANEIAGTDANATLVVTRAGILSPNQLVDLASRAPGLIFFEY
jgi:hypothetical protein